MPNISKQKIKDKYMVNTQKYFKPNKTKRLAMKKPGILILLILLVATNAFSQEIKEIGDVFYVGSEPYTGPYKTYYENGSPKIEMNLVNGLKDGTVRVY